MSGLQPDVVIEDPDWAALPLADLAQRACDAVAARMGLSDWEVTVLACGDDRIAELNADFRDKPRPTNVLSWPSQERAPDTPGAQPAAPEPDMFGDRHLGDIALAYGVCCAEAAQAALAPGDHVTHLITHGILHLLGFDHETDADAHVMERLEAEILATMGIADPYVVRDAETVIG